MFWIGTVLASCCTPLALIALLRVYWSGRGYTSVTINNYAPDKNSIHSLDPKAPDQKFVNQFIGAAVLAIAGWILLVRGW